MISLHLIRKFYFLICESTIIPKLLQLLLEKNGSRNKFLISSSEINPITSSNKKVFWHLFRSRWRLGCSFIETSCAAEKLIQTKLFRFRSEQKFRWHENVRKSVFEMKKKSRCPHARNFFFSLFLV